jgi:hypothetical protein
MGRWFGYTLAETRAMTLEEVHMLDGFLLRHPPVDVLVAAYLGYKEPGKADAKVTRREALKMNSEALDAMPPRRHVKTLAQKPAFVRTPDFLKLVDDLRLSCQTN